MNIAAAHTSPIAPARHYLRKRVDRATIMRPDVLDDVEIWAAGSLAAKSPIGMFHSAANYMPFCQGRGGNAATRVFIKISTEFIMSFAISSVTPPVGMSLFST